MNCSIGLVKDTYDGFLMMNFTESFLARSFWAFEHVYLPFYITYIVHRTICSFISIVLFLFYIFDVNKKKFNPIPLIRKKIAFYLLCLFCMVALFGGLGWEFYEYFSAISGLFPWFQEILHKKMLDLISDSIGIFVCVTCIYYLPETDWEQNTTHDILQLVLLVPLLLPVYWLPDIYLVLDTCKATGFNGTTYNYNTILTDGINLIPIGFISHVFIFIVILWVSYWISVSHHPKNKLQCKTMTILSTIYILVLFVPNLPWAFSTYATTWLMSIIFLIIIILLGSRGFIKDSDKSYSNNYKIIKSNKNFNTEKRIKNKK